MTIVGLKQSATSFILLKAHLTSLFANSVCGQRFRVFLWNAATSLGKRTTMRTSFHAGTATLLLCHLASTVRTDSQWICQLFGTCNFQFRFSHRTPNFYGSSRLLILWALLVLKQPERPSRATPYSLFLLGSTALLRVSACQFLARAFRDCSSLGLRRLRLAKGPQTADGSHFRQAETKRVLCEHFALVFMSQLLVGMLLLCCSCLHTVAYVLVAWCKTSHERSLCLLRRVLVKSCPVARCTAARAGHHSNNTALLS